MISSRCIQFVHSTDNQLSRIAKRCELNSFLGQSTYSWSHWSIQNHFYYPTSYPSVGGSVYRSYAKEAKGAEPKFQKKEQRLVKSAHHRLAEFFEDDYQEKSKLKQKKYENLADTLDRGDYKHELADETEQQALLEHQHDLQPGDYDRAMGLSSRKFEKIRPNHRPAKTKVVQNLESQGLSISPKDLNGMDYNELKTFLEEHQFLMEDYFTTVKSEEGVTQELNVALGPGKNQLNSWGDALDGPIEASGNYKSWNHYDPKLFRDRIRVRCMAGQGGRGGVSFYRDTRVMRGPPDGGDGGSGGSIIFLASPDKKPSLASLQPSYKAGHGKAGSSTRKRGKNGEDVIIEVPLGTTIVEFRSKERTDAEILQSIHDEQEMEDEEQKETFMLPPEYLPQKNQLQSQHQPLSLETPEDINELSPEQLLSLQQGNAKSSDGVDPRVGRPWQAPNLPNSHPMQKPAQEFHKMLEDYHRKSDLWPSNDPNPSSSKAKFLDVDEDDFGQAESQQQALLDKYRLKSSTSQSSQPQEDHLGGNKPRQVDLDEPGAYFVAAKGGAGGLGNWRLGAVRGKPQDVATPGKKGENLMYQLDLKLIADVGLVGFPNAGKSTFLASVSRAQPKIASYAFTTLAPQIGTVNINDYAQFTVADLPGLIEGAHQNRGLGHQFLKHIERTRVLIFVLDMSGADGRDPFLTFCTLWDELERYHETLVKKPCIIVANKMDTGKVASENLKVLSSKLKSTGKQWKNLKVYPTSTSSNINLGSVIDAICDMLQIPKQSPMEQNVSSRIKRANESGFVAIKVGSHLNKAIRNVK